MNYLNHIHHTHRTRIKELFEERYSISELFIMYRDVLHERDKNAYIQLRASTKDIKRPGRI